MINALLYTWLPRIYRKKREKIQSDPWKKMIYTVIIMRKFSNDLKLDSEMSDFASKEKSANEALKHVV